jgi:glycerol kinase
MLYNIHEKAWDSELLSMFRIPESMLPEIKNPVDDFGNTKNVPGIPDGIPVYAMAGDQQAALFGQLCTKPGEGKNTYGTGAFLLFHTGQQAVQSTSGLITTLSIDEEGKPGYALEGSIFIAGAVVQWLRDYMRFFAEASDTEEIIRSIEDDEDEIAMVPAFAGLGAPHWDMNARGAIFGISRDTTPARIIRAAIKSVGLQSLDLVQAMEKDTGRKMDILRVDGGMASNDYLLQYQSDVLGIPVIRPANLDTSALGVAYLAGMKAGFWSSLSDLKALEEEKKEFQPLMSPEKKEREIMRWNDAIHRVKGWLD